MAWIAIATSALGQPPGTLPPETRGPIDGSPRDPSLLKPRAFMFQDSAGNPVMVPGMSFEQMDQLLRIQDGLETPAPRYTIESVRIDGRIDDGYAELNITSRVTVEPTEGKWVSVPLRMGNFHRTGPADVSGVEKYRFDLDQESGGHLLHVQTDVRREVVVAMRAVSRVSLPPTGAIEFRLPEAASTITLNVPLPDVSASIVGRGDEVIRTRRTGRASELVVECGGGPFSLRFGPQVAAPDNRPVLETQSKIVVDWQQADDSPLVSVELSVRNLRGDLPRMSFATPKNLRLLQQPRILNAGPFEVLDSAETERFTGESDGVTGADSASKDDGVRKLELVPLTTRGDSRVEVSIEGQLRSEGGRAGGMVVVSGIEVDNAVEQGGEIEIRTPRDYRLRWTPHPWVQSLWDKSDSESLSTRTYRFRFDRVPFELPMWLSARAKQMRIESDLRLTLYDSLATLRMTMRTSGSIPDSRILPLGVGDWTVQRVTVADSSNAIEYDVNGKMLEVDLSSLPSGGVEGDRIEVLMVRPMNAIGVAIPIALPTVGEGDASIGALPSTLTISSPADSRFIIDVASSIGVGDVSRGTNGEETLDPNDLRYGIADLAQTARVVGYLVRERPQLSLRADAEISIFGDQLVEVIDWTVYPQGGLRGRLAVQWGSSGNPLSTEASTSSQAVDRIEGVPSLAESSGTSMATSDRTIRLSPLPLWSVVVDDSPAILRADAEGMFQVFSDRLAGGPHRIRFRRSRALTDLSGDEANLAGVVLPRPAVVETTQRGPIVVRLRGSDAWSLMPSASLSRAADELTFSSIPMGDLPLRIGATDRRDDDVVIRRAVLRGAYGQRTHHEQLLAVVEGGGLLRIGLSREQMLARATIDGNAVEVTRDAADHCYLRLGEPGTHQVNLQVWAPRESNRMIDPLEPIMRLPLGIERLYWQIVVPQDEHLIWMTPTMGRAMRWQFDRWTLYREPTRTESELVAWAGSSEETRMPPGNVYLFVGSDGRSLSAMTMSRLAIWLIVASVAIGVSTLLMYVPRTRHPMTVVVAAVALGGLTLLLPDASVMAGQLMLVAMLMIAVMSGVRNLLTSRSGTRVLESTRESSELPSARGVSASRRERDLVSVAGTDAGVPTGSVAEFRP